MKRYCKKCHSLERQRTLARFLDSPFCPVNLGGKEILHLSGAVCEREILKKIPGAKSRALDIRPGPHIDIAADICAMPQVADKSFDLILCCQVLPYVHDLAAALSELWRVLKDDGVLLQSNFSAPDLCTRELAEVEDITVYYGQEEYEKYRVGSYRAFGEVGLDDIFSPGSSACVMKSGTMSPAR